MLQFLTRGLESVSSILFPPHCAACSETLPSGFNLFCENCLMGLSLLEAEGRCHRCFCPREGHDSCGFCRELPRGLRQQAVCFEESPISHQLLSLLSKGIATTAVAGYLVLQMERLRWPLPDLVVPTPGDWFDTNERWEVRKLLAKEVARILNRPYAHCTKTNRYLFPIRHESLEAQPHFTSPIVLCSSSEAINRVVLIIHDEYKTGNAISLTAKSLKDAGAQALYALSLVAESTSPLIEMD